MHELSIAFALLKQVERVKMEQGAAAVKGITLRLGPLCGIEAELLQAAYMQLQADGAAEQSGLHIVVMPVEVYCPECDAKSEVLPNRLGCPQCGNARTVLKSGDEMMLESVDLVMP